MAKFHGKVGYATSEETAPGVWTETIVEHDHTGDVIRNTNRWDRGDQLNDDLNVSNQFSIVGDAFAYDNFSSMRYIIWMNTSWKIINVDIQRPRLILTVGGKYNGA